VGYPATRAGRAAAKEAWDWFIANTEALGIEEIHDLPIDVTGSHAKLVNLGGDMPGIAWHILLVEAHFAVAGAQ
jgi:hypothetical protein